MSPITMSSLSPLSFFGISLFGLSATMSTSILSLVAFAGYVYWRCWWSITEGRLPYGNLPGPPPTSLLKGALKEVLESGPGEAHMRWINTYGKVIWYHGFVRQPRIYISDPTAMNYILSRSELYYKDTKTREVLSRFLGNGLLVAEGDVHKRQRRIMHQSFTAGEVKENHLPIFLMKANETKDFLFTLTNPTTASTGTKSTRIDISTWMTKATLDVIGLAGFDYDFQALQKPTNELADAYKRMFNAGTQVDIWVILGMVIPGMHMIPTKRARTQKTAFETVNRIGKRLVKEKKDAIQASGGDVKGESEGKDLLSLIIRANLDPSLNAGQRMTDSEVLGQISTFILAGQETSSNALTWGFWQLSKRQAIQDKLREECLTVGTDSPTMSQLENLHYLQAVIAETLRLNGPVPTTARVGMKDTVIPIGLPVRGRDGTMMESVVCPKGTPLLLGLRSMNNDPNFWGSDADEFNPERWLTEDGQPKNACNTAFPGVWSNMMSFLGGPHGCIGYRFAIAEIKAIMFVLIRSFVFEECDPKVDIIGKTSIVTRPVIRGEEKRGMQMPLMVRPVM